MNLLFFTTDLHKQPDLMVAGSVHSSILNMTFTQGVSNAAVKNERRLETTEPPRNRWPWMLFLAKEECPAGDYISGNDDGGFLVPDRVIQLAAS